MHVSHLDEAAAFVTLDGSTSRGAVHTLINTGEVPIRLLCCCAPAYSDTDTILTGG